jgi:hypothetical protein
MGHCIYCKKDSSGSIDRPHIVPEAFLRNDTTLPVGVECDQCNKYASKIEQAFVHHNRIWVPIMILGAPGKGGKLRKRLGFYKARGEKGHLTFRFPHSWIRIGETGSYVQAPNPPEFDSLNFNKCLGHIALNYIAWKLGWDEALNTKYDGLRRFVRYGNRGETWPYGQVSFDDMGFRRTLTLGFADNAPGQIIRFRSYIDDFYIDPLNKGLLENYIMSKEGRERLYFP